MYLVIDEVLDVRLPGEKPVELVKYSLPVHTLGSKHRKSFREVVAHLTPKEAVG